MKYIYQRGGCIKIASLPLHTNQVAVSICLRLDGREIRCKGRTAAAIASIWAKSISPWKTIMLEIWIGGRGGGNSCTGSRTVNVFNLLLLPLSVTALNNGFRGRCRVLKSCLSFLSVPNGNKFLSR